MSLEKLARILKQGSHDQSTHGRRRGGGGGDGGRPSHISDDTAEEIEDLAFSMVADNEEGDRVPIKEFKGVMIEDLSFEYDVPKDNKWLKGVVDKALEGLED